MKRTFVVLIVVAVLLAAIGGAYWMGAFGWLTGTWASSGVDPEPSDENEATRDVAALGRLEPADGVLTVAAMVGDRLTSLEVKQDDRVVVGQTLGYLDSRRLRELELQSRESQLDEARSRRAAEEALADARITTAQLAVDQAKAFDVQIDAQRKQVALLGAALALEQRKLVDLRQLSPNLVSRQERETQALQIQKTAAELAAAEAALDKIIQESRFAEQEANANLRAAAAGKQQVLSAVPVQSLEKGVELAREQYMRTAIIAPLNGTIMNIYTRPGELIGQKPVLRMADLSRMVCVAEVYEADVKRIRLGQTAVIHSNALPAPADREGLQGRVVHIGQMVASPELTAIDPFAAADRHVVEVRVELDPASSRVAARMVNLQVDVTFLGATSP